MIRETRGKGQDMQGDVDSSRQRYQRSTTPRTWERLILYGVVVIVAVGIIIVAVLGLTFRPGRLQYMPCPGTCHHFVVGSPTPPSIGISTP